MQSLDQQGRPGSTRRLILRNDRLAPVYDLWGHFFARPVHQLIERRAALRDGESFLEVGVGTGLCFVPLAASNPAGRNEGVDLSDEMLQRCRRRLQQHGIQGFQLRLADARRLPFADTSFDVLLCCYVLNQLPPQEIDLALRDFWRVLRPGGRLLLANVTDGSAPALDLLARYLPSTRAYCQPLSLGSRVLAAGFQDVSWYTYRFRLLRSEILRGIRLERST